MDVETDALSLKRGVLSEEARKPTEKVLPPELAHSSPHWIWLHEEVLPGQRSLSVGM